MTGSKGKFVNFLHELIFELSNAVCLHFTNNIISYENRRPKLQRLLHVNRPWLSKDAMIINHIYLESILKQNVQLKKKKRLRNGKR